MIWICPSCKEVYKAGEPPLGFCCKVWRAREVIDQQEIEDQDSELEDWWKRGDEPPEELWR